MMDHKALLAALPAEQRRRLSGKSDLRGLAHLALHGGAVAGLATLVAWGVPFWPILLLPLGILIVFLFTLLHETVHLTPFRTRWLNQVIGHACGFALGLPAIWFRHFHLAHHRFTQDPANDPELAGGKPDTPGRFVLHVTGLPLWRSHVATLVRNAVGRERDGFVPARDQAAVRREARVMLALYAALAGASGWAGLAGMAGSSLLIWVWVVPALIGQPFLRVYLLAEHAGCPQVSNMLENTRTTLTHPLVRLVAWNMPYHAEHHAYPAVPFHRLPELHRICRPHLAVVQPGYARFALGYAKGLARAATTTVSPRRGV